jgi:pimeloyl-ACP methyl ester carboxylesterase
VTCAVLRYIAFGPEATPAMVAFMEGMVMQCSSPVRTAFGLAMADMELHHALANLTVPTIVMGGENDRLTPPSHARRMASLLPELADLKVFPKTGHMGPLERADEYSAALADLASRAQSGAQASLAAAA